MFSKKENLYKFTKPCMSNGSKSEHIKVSTSYESECVYPLH